MSKFFVADEIAMGSFGAALAALLEGGDTICLIGNLGAGKTTLARAIIASKTGHDDAPSPTYTLVQTYEAPSLEIWHADLYRIEDPSEVEELGLEEAFDVALVLVEWPDRLGPYLPDDRVELEITPTQSGFGRAIDVTGYGLGEARAHDIVRHIPGSFAHRT